MNTTKKAFRIVNTTSGADLGWIIAESKRDAMDVLARDAGYADAVTMHVETRDPGYLHDYATSEYIRRATSEEYAASLRAAESDTGAGVITVDGRRCYVTGPEVGHELRVREIEVTVTLRSGDTGLDSEEEYDAWTSYVTAKIDERAGLYVELDAKPFSAGGSDSVVTDDRGDDEELVERVREALRGLWDDWCAEGEVEVEPTSASASASAEVAS